MKPKAYWTTAEGQKIPYLDLTDDHLTNIMNDGYRNPQLLAEAKKRGLKYRKTEKEKRNPENLKVIDWITTILDDRID